MVAVLLTLSVEIWNGSGVVAMDSVCAAELSSPVACGFNKNVSFCMVTGSEVTASVLMHFGSSTIATIAIVKFTRNA